MTKKPPDWFLIGEESTSQVMGRIAESVSSISMAPQVKFAPMLAHWFVLDALLLANQANRDGMHANALSLTRQCIESITIIELGLCGHPDAEEMLLKWNENRIKPGNLRAWMQDNVWGHYGSGLWSETWSVFMREFASAVQPYAHYTPSLAQWQLRVVQTPAANGPDEDLTAVIQITPRAYDAQKATRISLFHIILTYTLGRIWMAANKSDVTFAATINRLGAALGKSRYLDGHRTDWGQQFWAMVWSTDGGTILE
jgi:hypothetical protein